MRTTFEIVAFRQLDGTANFIDAIRCDLVVLDQDGLQDFVRHESLEDLRSCCTPGLGDGERAVLALAACLARRDVAR